MPVIIFLPIVIIGLDENQPHVYPCLILVTVTDRKIMSSERT